MTDFQKRVLEAVCRYCTPTCGYATGGIAQLVGRQSNALTNRMHSAAVGAALRALEGDGLVARADSEKPVIWVRA